MDRILSEETIISHLEEELDSSDLQALASTCKSISSSLTNDSFWKRKTDQEFGSLFTIYHFFTSTSVDVAPDLKVKYMHPPSSGWRHYYQTKHDKLSQTDQAVLKKQTQQEVEDATLALEKCIEEDNSISFNHLVSKMLWILDLIPHQGGCYYVLASILYYLHHDDQADFVLKEGRRMDPGFQPLAALEFDLSNERWAQNQSQQHLPPPPQSDQQQISQRRRSSLKLPVLDPDGTALSSPLLQVLDTLFAAYDKDQDDALRNEELDHYVFSTNGQHPSQDFLEAMGQRFGANDKGWLTKAGFMAFYLEQTLGDQDETRKDIAAHGYDRWTLRKL